MVSSRIRVI